MVRSPCEAYLKYLIVHPDSYDNEHIRSVVRMQGLDYLGNPYLDRLRNTCVAPNPFFPEDEMHVPSMRFLAKEQLHSIFNPDEAMRNAWLLLDRPRAKEIIESMLITKSQPSWVCTALRREGYGSTPLAIERYEHYFFNLSDVHRSQLEAILTARGVLDKTNDPDEQVYATALARTNRTDVRVLSAQAAVPALAGMMNLIRMGVMPSNLEVSRLVKATQAVATYRMLETGIQDKPARGRDYSFMAKMATEMLESIGDVEEDLQEGLKDMILATEEAEVPHIKELTAGSHTLDVQPINTGEVDATVKK